MGFEFTALQCLKTVKGSTLDPDLQICEMVKRLNGRVKKWFVLAPTPLTRVLYFEPDEGFKKLEPVKGSETQVRAAALGRDSLTKERKRKVRK